MSADDGEIANMYLSFCQNHFTRIAPRTLESLLLEMQLDHKVAEEPSGKADTLT